MKSFSSFLSHLFRILLIFLLFFVWVRFYEKDLVSCLVYTSILTFFIDCLFTLFLQKKDVKANLKKKELSDADNFANYFIFNSKSIAINFWNNLLSEEFKTIKKSNYIIYTHLDLISILYPFYSITKFNAENLVQIFTKLKNIKCDKVIICANEIDPSAKELANKLSLKFILLNKYESYEKLMKKYNYFPPKVNEINIKPTNKFKSFLALTLNKKRTKEYLFASIILIISSYFVKISIYYLIVSSLLLILAIFSFTNSMFNSKTTNEIL